MTPEPPDPEGSPDGTVPEGSPDGTVPEGSPDGTVPEGSPDGTVQDQVFDMVQRSQESIIDATRNFADGMSDLVPASREQVDKVIDSAFDLTEKVLQIQRDFAKSVVRTVTPPIGGSDDDDNG